MLAALERALAPRCRVLADRARAMLWRIRGAGLGPRVRVGARCVVHRPWRVQAGEDCHLEHNVFLKVAWEHSELRIGRGVFIGCGSEFDVALKLEIGDDVLIAPGVFITDHNHLIRGGLPIVKQRCEEQSVVIGAGVWLGARAVVLPGVTVGAGAVVAAGAVVTRDVEAMSIVAGVPARKIGMRD